MELIFSKAERNIISLFSAASLDNASKFVKFDETNQNAAEVHLGIFTLSYREKKSCLQLYIQHSN